MADIKNCKTCTNAKCVNCHGRYKDDLEEHHEVCDIDWVFDCKKHNKWKGV